jgi:hypothetical protein
VFRNDCDLIFTYVILMIKWMINDIYLYIIKEEQGGYVKKINKR